MGKQLVEFPLREGGSVLVEVDDRSGRDEVTRGWGDRDQRVVKQAQQSFEQVVGRVQPAIQGLVEQLRGLTDSPEQIQVEFGLQLSAEVGAFVAGATTTGNFKVSVTWQRDKASGGGRPG